MPFWRASPFAPGGTGLLHSGRVRRTGSRLRRCDCPGPQGGGRPSAGPGGGGPPRTAGWFSLPIMVGTPGRGWPGQHGRTSGGPVLAGARRDVASVARAIARFEPVAMSRALIRRVRARPPAARGWRSSRWSATTCGCGIWGRCSWSTAMAAWRAWTWVSTGGGTSRCTRTSEDRPWVLRCWACRGSPPVRRGRRRTGGGWPGDRHGHRESSIINPNRNPGMSKGQITDQHLRSSWRRYDDLGPGPAGPRHHRRSHRWPGTVRPARRGDCGPASRGPRRHERMGGL